MRPATRHQVGKIKGEYKRIGTEDRAAQLKYTILAIGHTIDTHNELKHDEALKLIEHLMTLDPPAEQMELTT
jgi:hypothetical protein